MKQTESSKSEDLYGLKRWGKGYFDVSGTGHIQVIPDQDHRIDIKELCDDLIAEGITPPILLRFSDILRRRMQRIHYSFQQAKQAHDYQADYFGVYPIKVNQQYQVVEEIIEYGAQFNWGLEAGSKPELHATLAMLEDLEGLIVCNGYKDREFVHLALLARKMGKRIFLVIEKPEELSLILETAKTLDIEPLIGLRCRLAASGHGLWMESGGDASKFGLSPHDIIQAVDQLKQDGLLHCLRLLHFHIGSQVPKIQFIKTAMRELSQFYVELRSLGAPIDHIDVGGGLGVDYDGSFSGDDSSVDYSIGEYAESIVATLKQCCEQHQLPHPNIISESGRALVAHHAMLIVNVLDVEQRCKSKPPTEVDQKAPPQVQELITNLRNLNENTARINLHNSLALREEVHRLFTLGHCNLQHRALADRAYWHTLQNIAQMPCRDEVLSIELQSLLADRYFCNFSVFQSLPDSWAIGQTFPICPIHRLNEAADRQGILVDISCDSDGKLDHFPSTNNHSSKTLPLHSQRPNETYLLGIFMLGAYQEILGDLHNLFGDTHAVHIRWDEDHHEIEQLVHGESVVDVLEYVQFHEKVLMDRMRRQMQQARKKKILTAREANAFLKFYQQGLHGYTYLES